ncbi:MAG: hypothetical protein ACFFBR_00290 [Promethearchaeota archaeon]
MATTARTQHTAKEKLTTNQRRHHRQEITKQLKTIQREITELTDRSPLLPTRIQFYDDDTLTSPRFCGSYGAGKFRIASQLLTRPLLLKTVLYREMYTTLIPSVVKGVPESGDLGILCAYHHTAQPNLSQLMKLWQVVSPRQFFGDTIYNAPYSFPLFNRVTQGTFLKRILPHFDELEPAITPLTSREYVELLETFMLNYASPLNEQELRVLHLMIENPTSTLRQLQQISSYSLGSLSNYLASFREKLLFSRYFRINYPRIRLNHIAVLAYPAPGSRVSRYFEQCPYLRKIHRFGGSGAPFLLSYTLPRLRLRRLQEWLQELVGLGHLLRYRFYPLSGVFNGYNLRSYLAHEADVPVSERFRWVAWVRYLRDVLIREGYGEILSQPYIYKYAEPNVDPADLDPLAYQILSQVKPDTTAEDLALILGQSVHVVRRHLKSLITQEVLFKRPDLSMYHLGLNETLFIILEGSEEVVRNFLSGCREAPLYGGSIFHHPTPGCIVAFGLPIGLALKVERELNRLFLEQTDFDAAVFYGSGAKDFIMNQVRQRCQFNTELGQWQWFREYLPTAFDHLESQVREIQETGSVHFTG